MTQAVLLLDLTSLAFVDVSTIGPNRTVMLVGNAPTLALSIEVTNDNTASDFVQVGELSANDPIATLPETEAAKYMRVRVTAGSLGVAKVYVTGPNEGSVQINLTTSTQDVSSIGVGRMVYVRGGSGVSIAIEAAESLIATQFREIGRIFLAAGVRVFELPTDSSNFVRYRVAQGTSPTTLHVWIAGGPTGVGGSITLAGDVTGPSNANVVEKLTGAAGVVTLPSGSTVQQTQPADGVVETSVRTITHSNNHVFSLYLAGSGSSNNYYAGWNSENQDPSQSCLQWIWSNLGDEATGTFISSLEAFGPGVTNVLRCITLGYTKATGANSMLVTGNLVQIGSIANAFNPIGGTAQTQLEGGQHYRTCNTVTVDIASVLAGTVGLVDAGLGLTNYAIRANANGQFINLQANVSGTIALDTPTTTINGNVQHGSATGAFGGGTGVTGVHDASVVPTTNPAAGGVLYSSGGQGAWRRSDGTVIGFG